VRRPVLTGLTRAALSPVLGPVDRGSVRSIPTTDVGMSAAALTLACTATLIALLRPTLAIQAGIALVGVAILTWMSARGRRVLNLVKRWPLRLLPLHVAAAFAAAQPDKVMYYGLHLAALTVIFGWRPRKPELPDMLAAALALWAAVATIGSGAQYGVKSAGYYWAACTLFVACRQVVTNRTRALSAIGCYIGGCLYVAWMVISQKPGEGTDYRPEINGLNINLAAYALVTAIAAVIAVMAIFRPPIAARLGLLAVIGVLGYAVKVTDTRAAVGALALGVVYLAVRRVTTGAGFLAIAIAVPVILAVVALNLVDTAHAGWLESPFDRQTGDLSGRTDVWPYARLDWLHSPIAGLGPRVFPTANPMQIGAHNLILTLGVDIGTVGVLLYAAVLAAALATYRHAGRIRHLGALLLLAWLPIWLTGHWELSPAAWLALAVWSHLPAMADPIGLEPQEGAGPRRQDSVCLRQ
jgi:O-antigen ligase